MPSKLNTGFEQANSNNLPRVTDMMTTNFFVMNAQYVSVHSTGEKFARSTRPVYGDAAIGFVQIKHDKNVYVVQAQVTPEHKVRKKGYDVEAVIKSGVEIVSAKCNGCVAAPGGCKHVIAFLFWLHRRSEEPSPTEVLSYWRKSELSKIGTSKTFMTLEEICGKKLPEGRNEVVIEEFLREYAGLGTDAILLNMKREHPYLHTSVYQLFLSFKLDVDEDLHNGRNFLKYCSENMSREKCRSIYLETKKQSESIGWTELRYLRVTASKLYACSHCSTDGSLVQQLFGAKIFQSKAMKRGLELEKQVIRETERKIKKKIDDCGLIIDPKYPIFGASPDGITEDHVVEVKCPISNKTFETYIRDGRITPKYNAQIQLQMKLADKNNGIFVVADSQFESNNKITILNVPFDNQLCETLMDQATQFWFKYVFSKL